VTRFPGLGNRLSEQLRSLGYWKDDRPDVGRFCREKDYRPQYVYAWLKDRMPAYDNVNRLCVDRGVPVVWFVTGAETDGRAAVSTRPAHARAHLHREVRPDAATPAARLGLGSLREAIERIVTLEADLTALLAAFPDPCLWLDETGRVLDARGAQIAAVGPAATGKTLRELFPAEAATRLHRALGQAIRTDRVVTVEYDTPGAGSKRVETFEARIRPVIERTGRRARKVLVIIRDVTERRQRETEYRDLVEGAANGLCIYSGDTIQFANRAIVRMLGYATPADLAGREVREVLPDHRTLRAPGPGRTVTRPTATPAVRRDGERMQLVVMSRAVTWRSQTATLLTIVAS
jgi:PAS domain S-box-containing protein